MHDVFYWSILKKIRRGVRSYVQCGCKVVSKILTPRRVFKNISLIAKINRIFWLFLSILLHEITL